MLSIKTDVKRGEVQYSWKSGPLIQAFFYTKEWSISQITISFAEKFSCSIFGNTLHEMILEWMENYSKRKEGKELPLDFTNLSFFTINGLRTRDNRSYSKTTQIEV